MALALRYADVRHRILTTSHWHGFDRKPEIPSVSCQSAAAIEASDLNVLKPETIHQNQFLHKSAQAGKERILCLLRILILRIPIIATNAMHLNAQDRFAFWILWKPHQ
jgi:hypothetical protein